MWLLYSPTQGHAVLIRWFFVSQSYSIVLGRVTPVIQLFVYTISDSEPVCMCYAECLAVRHQGVSDPDSVNCELTTDCSRCSFIFTRKWSAGRAVTWTCDHVICQLWRRSGRAPPLLLWVTSQRRCQTWRHISSRRTIVYSVSSRSQASYTVAVVQDLSICFMHCSLYAYSIVSFLC